MRVALVGDVGSGKSTLLGRLLYETRSVSRDRLPAGSRDAGEIPFASIIDQLEEERRDHTTADTTQAVLRWEGHEIVFIDVPGQFDLLRNALTGASEADAALLVVDATRGLRPQTFRHAYMLQFLGVTDALIAINKMDLLGWDRASYEALAEEARSACEDAGLSAAACIAVSAREGRGLAPGDGSPVRQRALLRCLADLAPHGDDEGGALVVVQGILPRAGTPFVLGRLARGTLAAGDTLRIFPARSTVTVREIRTAQGPVDRLGPGRSVAIVLSEEGAGRGSILCAPECSLSVAGEIVAEVLWLAEEDLTPRSNGIIHSSTQTMDFALERIIMRRELSKPHVLLDDLLRLRPFDTGRIELRLGELLVFEEGNVRSPIGRFVMDYRGTPAGIGRVLPTEKGRSPGRCC